MLRFLVCCIFVLIFFFKQKTAYEMRISDWSSDVCSSDLHRDLLRRDGRRRGGGGPAHPVQRRPVAAGRASPLWRRGAGDRRARPPEAPEPADPAEIGRAHV